MAKHKLQLHRLALHTGENGAEDLVLLVKKNEYVQLSYDKWLVRNMNSDRDDLSDRTEIRETELTPLLALSKEQLLKFANELQLLYDNEHLAPLNVRAFFSRGLKNTKAELVTIIERMWDDHAMVKNRKKQEEKQKAAKIKRNREDLLQEFRTMNPTTVGMYIPLIIEQLTDDQVQSLLRQVTRDQRELITRLGPISLFGPRFPH